MVVVRLAIGDKNEGGGENGGGGEGDGSNLLKSERAAVHEEPSSGLRKREEGGRCCFASEYNNVRVARLTAV
jgi:hypothetical protein